MGLACGSREELRHELHSRETDPWRRTLPRLLVLREPQLDDREEHSRELAAGNGGLLLEQGTISLQSESHPIEFRRVELRRLD